MRAAELVAETVRENPSAVIALPTGETPKGMYAELGALHRAGLDFSGVTIFNLDEYVGLEASSPLSYAYFMARELYRGINVPESSRRIFDSMAADPEEECRRYDRAVEEAGGIDLAVVGIGRNGHIAFNEPADALHVGSHVQALDRQTLEVNFEVGLRQMAEAGRPPIPRSKFPTHAMTMGFGPIMAAVRVLVLVTGSAKAEPMRRMLDGTVTTRFPASVLQLHRNCAVLADERAAAGSR